MARFGEGDPRWIVEDRIDGKNVNNWHWTERDVTGWSVDKIKSLFQDAKYSEGPCHFEINHVNVLGTATINTRKGKLKFIYDLEISLDYTFKENEIEDSTKGRIDVPEFSFDTGSDDISMNVSIDVKTQNSDKAYQFVKSHAKGFIQPKLKEFLSLFFDVKTHGLEVSQPAISESTNKASSSSIPSLESEKKAAAKKNKKLDCDQKSAEIEVEFCCPPDFAYDIFTQPDKISAFTRSNAQFENRVGGSFSFLDNNISGKVLATAAARVVMSWRFKDWPDDYYSQVTLEFLPCETGTRLRLNHNNILAEDYEKVTTGWDRYFFKPIQQVFGIGTGLLNSSLF